MEHKPDIVSLLETRVSGTKADNIIAKLGFQFSHHVKAIGYSGSIWIGWKDTICLDVIHSHSQFIVTKVRSTLSSYPIFIAFVYGSPNSQKRKEMWFLLKYLIRNDNSLWAAIRDFNVILSPAEKLGGCSNGKRCPFFGDFMDKAELSDLGFHGSPFTWHRGTLFERLDRAVRNKAWLQKFSNSVITHLPKIKSDHRPLLFALNLSVTLPRGRPFRFLVGWTEHPDFGNFVKDNWSFSGNMSVCLRSFSHNLKDWNKDVYGYITSRKRLLTKELAKIQRIMDFSGSNSLAPIELHLRQ